MAWQKPLSCYGLANGALRVDGVYAPIWGQEEIGSRKKGKEKEKEKEDRSKKEKALRL